jgi:cytochrome c biogenesis protein CcmG, thiol:disulfide interchange protein DsbE
MTARRQWVAVGVAAAIVAAGAVAAHALLGREFALVTVGSRAPNFRAQTLDTPPHTKSLADYSGRVVMLNIWATWCAPCREEMPSLEVLQRAYGPRGLAIVAVSVDDSDATAVVRGFVREYGLTFDVLHDASGSVRDIYQTTGVPETFVIARDGTIRKKAALAQNWASPGNQSLIEQLLNEGHADRGVEGRGE